MLKKFLFIFVVMIFGVSYVSAAEVTVDDILTEFKSRGNYFGYCNSINTSAVGGLISINCNFSDTGYYSVGFTYSDGMLTTSQSYMHLFENGAEVSGQYGVPIEDDNTTVSPSIDFAVQTIYEMLEVVYVLKGYDPVAAELYVKYADLESFTLEDNGFAFSSMPQYSTIEEITYKYLDQYSFKIDTNKVSIPSSSSVPSISIKEVGTDYVVIEDKLDPEDNSLECSIYSSTSRAGVYKPLFTAPCMGESTDKLLTANTKYFYKMCLVGYTNCTNVLEVTTKSLPTNVSDPVVDDEDNNSEEVIENPKTGVTVGVVGLIIIALFSIISLRVLNRKSLFKRL